MVPTRNEARVACLTCRQRKVACNRQHPKCGLCLKNNLDCQYQPRRHQPGLRAGYVSRLERHLGDVEERLRKVEAQLQPSAPVQDAVTESAGLASPNDDLQPDADDGLSISNEAEQNHSPIHLGLVATASPRSLTISHQTATPLDDGLVTVANKSLKIWFQKHHPYFPIVHEPSLRHVSDATSPRYELIWKAITAAVVLDQQETPQWERTIAEQARDQVLLQGMKVSSLQSVQALLILSNHYYSEGDLTQFWNIMAICKKMSLRLGLHNTTASITRTHTSGIAIATSFKSNSDIEKEEAIRAFWMLETLDSISTLGLTNYLMCPNISVTNSLPCLESTWALTRPILDPHAATRPQCLSSFSICVMLATEELSAIRKFLETSCDLSRLEQRMNWQSEAQRLDERLTNWREEFVAAVFRLINAENEKPVHGEMDPFFTLTNCVLNTSIAAHAPCPKGIETKHEPWAFATTRCVYACENLAAKVRRIEADQLDHQSPHLILPIFVAARFFVIYSKALDADVPANLHTLAFILHTFGKRWPLAQKYETIIRTAVAEHRSPISECVLPAQFYDLRYSALQIIDMDRRRW